jgi:NADH dehydrogenase FAD-containing subunit
MTSRVLALGAGFGGLELATMLSESLADQVEVTLIDKDDCFVFGYSKLDVMFSRATPEAVRLPYRKYVKPGVRLLQETITAIDPEARRVTTDMGTHEADVLVIALGADYDLDATPGLAESGDEFYSFAGAVRMRDASRASRMATPSSASEARRSSAHPRPASARCSCTTISSRAVSAATARSASSCHSGGRCLPRRRRRQL